MTDNEIIKALKCCCIEHACSKCHYSKTCSANCINKIMRDTLDLINLQKAEIEKKDTEIDILIRKKETLRDEISELRAEVKKIKSDLKYYLDTNEENGVVWFPSFVISNLVKELTEGNGNENN